MIERSLEERNKLVEANMKLVYRLANDLWYWARTKHMGEFDDLVSEGMIGLINAAKSWDESKGIKFSTFAYSCIKNEMIDAVRKGGVIQVPKYVLGKGNYESSRNNAKAAFRAYNCRQFSEDVNGAFGDGDRGMGDGEEGNLEAEEENENLTDIVDIRDKIRKLEEGEKWLLWRRDWMGDTFEAIGQVLGIGCQAVIERRIKILGKLRLALS